MIGHHDDYGIDIFVIQQSSIIVVGCAGLGICLFGAVFGLGQARGIDFAHGDGVFQILAHVLAAFVAHADATDEHPIAGRRFAACP